jgi:hypothetical protein
MLGVSKISVKKIGVSKKEDEPMSKDQHKKSEAAQPAEKNVSEEKRVPTSLLNIPLRCRR